MPGGAIVAAALTDHSVRTFALWLSGVDVLLQPGAGGNRYGVPIETIRVEEAAPPGVGSFSCSVEDALGVVPIPGAGVEVLFYDLAHDWPVFRGYVSTVDVRPHENGTGRWLDVEADGTEIDVDWETNKRDTISGESLVGHWMALVRAIPNLVVAQSTAPMGDKTTGIGAIWTTTLADGPFPLARESVRAGVLDLWNRRIPMDPTEYPVVAYIDARRIFRVHRNIDYPNHWNGISVSTAGPVRAANLHYSLEPGDYVEKVVVTGAGGTEYGPFSLGNGIHGKTALINDSTVSSSTTAQSVANAYLLQNAATIALRGTLDIESFAPGIFEIHPGVGIQITDASVGLTGQSFTMYSISRRYEAGGTLERWQVSFGGRVASGMRLVRRLTRAQGS